MRQRLAVRSGSVGSRCALGSDLRAILGEGAASSAMVGAGENYLPAFRAGSGLGQVAAGLISTIPLLAGEVLQLISPWAVQRLGSHRRWVFICAAVQAGSFVPLVAAALVGRMPAIVVFAVAALYLRGPGNELGLEHLGRHARAGTHSCAVFRRPHAAAQMATLGGFVGGGVTLQIGAWHGEQLLAFAVVFAAAGICRSMSAALLASQSEPRPRVEGVLGAPTRTPLAISTFG